MNPMLDANTEHAVRPDSTWTGILDCAVKEVFQIMLQTDLTSMPGSGDGTPVGDTTAMVGMAGALCGVLTIRCTSHTAESITSRMLGSTGPVNPSDVTDAIAEICNMVAGNFKGKITALADRCMLSVPTVIRGDDYEMVSIADGEQLSLCYAYGGSPIWICLAVNS
jgi:chemotaxis protein CheX